MDKGLTKAGQRMDKLWICVQSLSGPSLYKSTKEGRCRVNGEIVCDAKKKEELKEGWMNGASTSAERRKEAIEQITPARFSSSSGGKDRRRETR